MNILRTAVAALVATAGCAPASPVDDMGRFARVRITAERLGPGWHAGTIGGVGDCTVVLVGEPPEDPVRLYPVAFAEIAELRVSGRYDGTTPAREWTGQADTTGESWTSVSVDRLRNRFGDCRP